MVNIIIINTIEINDLIKKCDKLNEENKILIKSKIIIYN